MNETEAKSKKWIRGAKRVPSRVQPVVMGNTTSMGTHGNRDSGDVHDPWDGCGLTQLIYSGFGTLMGFMDERCDDVFRSRFRDKEEGPINLGFLQDFSPDQVRMAKTETPPWLIFVPGGLRLDRDLQNLFSSSLPSTSSLLFV
jgi:hypothetical protein